MTTVVKKNKKAARPARSTRVKISRQKEIKEEIAAVPKKEVKEVREALVVKREKEAELKRPYLYAVGRRKEAVAITRLYKNGKGKIIVNGKEYAKYFPTVELQQIVDSPLRSVGQVDKVDIEARVWGGGSRGQAEAMRLGVARALIQLNINFKKNLRKAGFLTRDPRVKERKKYGFKRARKAPQWQKR